MTTVCSELRRVGIAVALGTALAVAAAAPAQAAPPFLGPGGAITDVGTAVSALWGVSCPTTTACTVTGSMGVFLETSDGGATWAASNAPVSSDTVNNGSAYGTYYAVSCPAAHTCYASGASYIAETTDGQTWSVHDMSRPETLYGIHCLSTITCLAVGFDDVVMRTTDGGQHWTTLSALATGQYLAAIACPTASLCTAVGDAGAAIGSDNGGQSWTPEALPKPVPFFGLSCPDSTTCIAVGTAGAVAVTKDGGQHWAMQQSGTASDLYAIRCWDVHTCHAVGDAGTIIATTDGGATWAAQTSAFAAVGYPGVVCTTGYPPPVQGQSVCVTQPITPPVVGIDCTGSRTCIAVGGNETIQATTDGGATWSAVAPVPSGAGGAASARRTHGFAARARVVAPLQRQAGGRAVTRPGGTAPMVPAPRAMAPADHLDGTALRAAAASLHEAGGTGAIVVAMALTGVCLAAGRRRLRRLR